ncbi:MAG: c-type cytochrome [Candidatus Hydrogenedentes bacterium]|nr:c-type cytochrome [Candidatus Hydrogenedentota bacterium]
MRAGPLFLSLWLPLLVMAARPAWSAEEGEEIYLQRCFWCHGEQGDGNGPSTKGMWPLPRDFTQAQYIIRSTPHAELPSDEDLRKTISNGLPGTAMPGWNDFLSQEEIGNLVTYLKAFSPRFESESPETLPIPTEPASVERGEEVYLSARCSMCHGESRRGDGAITTALNFEWGIPFSARDFTRGWTFKGGHEPRDIYLRITGGMNGTPMGPYGDLLSDRERWDLAHYIASLDEEPNETSVDFLIMAALIDGAIPEEHDALEWDKARPVLVPLAGQVILDPPSRWWTPTAGSATIRGLWNGDEVAFLLEWNDPTGPDNDFSDSALLQFAAEDETKPYLLLGETDKPVKVWHWQVEGEEWTAEGVDNTTIGPPTFHVASSWEKGRWHVIFRRAIAEQPKFRPGNFVPTLISVRDGANGERGDVRAISTWLYTTLESPKTLRPWLMALIYVLGAVAAELWLVARLRS